MNKMDQMLISDEEVRTVIDYCEHNNKKLLHSATGLFTGHLQIGPVTYWVTYAKDGPKIRLCNIYSHRMSIEGDL